MVISGPSFRHAFGNEHRHRRTADHASRHEPKPRKPRGGERRASRQQQLLAATDADVRADYYSALQEYELRRSEVVTTLEPLRQHAQNIAEIAQGAYAQGGTDLLRLLDAQRSRREAELAYVQGMVAYQQSIANLQAAEGANP